MAFIYPSPFIKRKLTIIYPTTRIYVDGGHNKVTGDEAWGSVVNSVGEDLICKNKDLCSDLVSREVSLPVGRRTIIVSKFNDVAKNQNNGAELLALLFGLRYACKDSRVKEICTDSQLALYWSKSLNSSSREKMDPRKASYIDECIKLRKQFEENTGKIIKIKGDDNPADLGYH